MQSYACIHCYTIHSIGCENHKNVSNSATWQIRLKRAVYKGIDAGVCSCLPYATINPNFFTCRFSVVCLHTSRIGSRRCASGCAVECRICNREVAGSNLSLGYFVPMSTQPSIPLGSVNEYQLWLGRQRQVWLIPTVDERVGVQVKL